MEKERGQSARPKEEKIQQSRPKNEEKKKLSFKERRELEELDALIPKLEEERTIIENELSGGTLSADELMAMSKRIGELIEEIEEKTMRWLELSESA
jgi:ATP-binding cassette subfamily F protein uup